MRETNLAKRALYILSISLSFLFFLCSCNSNAEIENLKKENSDLKQQISELSQNAESEVAKGDYVIQFTDNKPMTYGNNEHKADIKNATIKYSPKSQKYILIINFHYENRTDKAQDFINDVDCMVTAYQNGIELDSPSYTSEKDIYNTDNSYKRIKNAEIDTQLAFELLNTESSIELELGWISPQTKELIIVDNE